jgi:hypothetical protein
VTAAEGLGDEHKHAVRRWVAELRRVLEDDFNAQLQRLGVRASGGHVATAAMHLDDEGLAARARVEALLIHDASGEGGPEQGYRTAVRELTYTLLNRLVGLKAMEARGLLYLPPPDESGSAPLRTEVLTPVPGQEYSRYLRDLRAARGSAYRYGEDAEERLLRDGLQAAFEHLTTEVALVFDPDHEYACVWPTHAALVDAIARINEDLPADAYRAPDLLGWVYQFFNRDEKERVRRETRGTPRTSYELAVINQFYTPGWVVKALVDNTLGRLWIQMHPDTVLRGGAADYLVPHTGEDIRYSRRTAGDAQSFKSVREITLLDPACGTMHFGQYAFTLFERMYLEELERAGEPGWPERPPVDRSSDIPAAIVENNLFGVDIDARAIQIASLSLLLTAKEAAAKHGATPADIRLRSTNLVVANAVPVAQSRLQDLVELLGEEADEPDLSQQLFRALWDNMRHISELGVLVRMRESVVELLDRWIDAETAASGLLAPAGDGGARRLGFGEEVDRARFAEVAARRTKLRARADALASRLSSTLESAAADASDPADQLFAEDTGRGLALLRVLARRYDVVVMNPPYGSFVAEVKDYVKAAYPLTSNDIYAAFIDRATQLTETEGYVGALVSSTFKSLTSFEKLRSEILLKRNPMLVMLDLGPGILDGATVETAGLVLAGAAP